MANLDNYSNKILFIDCHLNPKKKRPRENLSVNSGFEFQQLIQENQMKQPPMLPQPMSPMERPKVVSGF